MKIAKSNPEAKLHGWRTVAILAAVLSLLFWRSFLPGYVHFSNDGPLGQQMTAWTHLPQAFLGSWGDLNDIGANTGSYPLGVGALIRWVLGPVGYAKFLAPLALFILGLGAWAFFRQLKLSPLAATLGALAATLNSTFFATACWGVAPQQIAIGMDFFALALVVSNTPETPARIRWTRLALAGLAVGISVMEALDIGAIFSLFVAAFVFFKPIFEKGGPVFSLVNLVNAGRGVIHVVMIALFAGFIAFQTVVSQFTAQIQGVVGTGQDTESKAQHWNWATQWSLPKTETLGLFVPGIFGYKYDTPANMMDFLQNSYQGGVYWGLAGCDSSWDSYFAHGETGPEGQGILRWSGGQNYAGILVTLVALWTIAQSLRRQNSIFPETQQRFIWFWTGVLTVSLLLAWGRFAPFYKFLYMLPYFSNIFSNIRNPTKFILVFSWTIVILFAYGVHALNRRYLETPATGPASLAEKLKDWWRKAGDFDRNWTRGCIAAFIIGVLAWLVYAAKAPALAQYIQKAGFPDEATANKMASFSVGQVSWFIVLFALAVGICLLVLAGVYAGKRARLGGLLLGAFLVADLGRANLPYVTHLDYKQKNDTDPANSRNSINPIINLLRDKPYEHRVADLPFRVPPQLSLFEGLYRSEWMQHHFPYYNIQSLDVIQRPRLPADLEAYGMVWIPHSEDTAYLIARHWQLTNTRYLLGPAGFLDTLNEQFDPEQHRFRIVQRFNVVPRPGIEQPSRFEEMTTASDDNGAYALFDFAGALPRAKLYSHWQISTNDTVTLQTLASTNFDAWRTVLVSTPLSVASAANATNQDSGVVEFKSYPTNSTTDIVLAAQSAVPSVLLLNDRYDPHWSVTVDGKPAALLRCNFIMRGVYLTPGPHTVEFQFNLPHKPFYVTLTAVAGGILLFVFVFLSTRRNSQRVT